MVTGIMTGGCGTARARFPWGAALANRGEAVRASSGPGYPFRKASRHVVRARSACHATLAPRQAGRHRTARHGRLAGRRAAAEAGVAILEAGGNAIDAAVATALALATVEPWNSGLGGIGFALVHRAGQRRAEVVDFGPVAPRGLDPSRFPLTGGMKQDLFAWPEVEGDANIHGPLSFAIPVLDRGLCAPARALGPAAVGRGDRAGAGAGEARPAGGLVHHVEGGRLGLGAAALSGKRAHLPAGRTAADRALSGRAGLLPPRPAAGHPGALGARRAARFLRGRHRRARSSPTSRRWAACWTPRICAPARPRMLPAIEVPWRKRDVATHRRADRGAHARARAGADGAACRWGARRERNGSWPWPGR